VRITTRTANFIDVALKFDQIEIDVDSHHHICSGRFLLHHTIILAEGFWLSLWLTPLLRILLSLAGISLVLALLMLWERLVTHLLL
jgi:hypothetical protein